MSFVYITEDGAFIRKRGGSFVVGQGEQEVMEIPEAVLDGLVLVDSVQVSSRAMVEFLRLGIPVMWLSRRGAFFGRLESTRHVHVFRQEQQVLQKGKPFYLALAKKCIAAKVHNQLTILRRCQRYHDSEELQKAVYDITENKRRSQMVKCLEKYGVRVQKSAFEAFLTKKKYEHLMSEAQRFIDETTDSLRIYLLANHTMVRTWGDNTKQVDDVIIF